MQGRVVLITGAARRIGAAIARELHRAGGRVVLHCRSSRAEAEKLAAELNGARAASAAVVQADLLDLDALPRMVEEAARAFGRLDGLVNNASSFHATPFGSIGPEQWKDLMGSNLRAPLFVAQAAAPHLRNARGAIVNIIDIHAEFPMKSYVVYNIAKGGLVALTRSLARELGPEVRVNGIAPGTILWPDDDAWTDEVSRQRIMNQTALKRIGEPDDIAKAVYFLIAEATYVTGETIRVDGGRHVAI